MQAAFPFKKRLRLLAAAAFNAFRQYLPLSSDGFRVLLYHSVTDKLDEADIEENTIHKELFHSQMEYLSVNKFNVISASEAVKSLIAGKKFPASTICIAFDDGYRNILRNAFPILQKFNFPCTIFVTNDLVGNDGYLNKAELKDLSDSGLAELGGHGKTHRALSSLRLQELKKEISDSRGDIEEITGTKVVLFAYPFGHSKSYNRNTIAALKISGFLGAFNNIYGFNRPGLDPFKMYRNRISWMDEIPEFRKHLNGSYDWENILEVFRRKRSS